MDIRTGRHVVFMIHAHLVFTTKKRGKVLSSQHLDRLKEIFAAICVDFEAELREFNGERDHVHLLVNYPPKVRLSELVNSFERCLQPTTQAGVPGYPGVLVGEK